ncbi:MAG: hypothetical protein M1839_005821 [Geoglossum umbratile]|nr:MAG: hypothetical protein M1839_005821 [Geoglossum umbratile]
MASSTDSQQQQRQTAQTIGSPDTAIGADPSGHSDNSTAVVPGVELNNLGSAGNFNDVGTPTTALMMSSTTSPGRQSSASAQNRDQTASAEPSSPTAADPAPPRTPPATATAPDAAPSQSPTKELKPTLPSIQITLLLITGARHPYKIDERYLRKRDVNFADNDPFTISVYTLKELIWKDWREEWEPRPTSPSSIRLIQFGRLLEDKAQLKDCRFNADSPNVLHMSVKPQEVVDDEDAAKAKHGLGSGRERSLRSTSCRCVIL